MDNGTTANARMKTYWDEEAGAHWVAQQAQLDLQMAPYGEAVLAQAALEPGQRVLDVGCGCGATTVGAAERIGARGRLVGVDLSRPMLECAGQRIAAAGFEGTLELLAEDAQIYPFEADFFDAVLSRFGVMFFDDPSAAFRNLARATRRGGCLVFSCWQTRERNVWMTAAVEAALQHLEPPPPPEPGAPGPFSLAVPRHTQTFLEEAGYTDIAITPAEEPLQMGSADTAADLMVEVGPVASLVRDQTPSDEVISAVRDAVRAALHGFESDGAIAPPAAAWIVRATRA